MKKVGTIQLRREKNRVALVVRSKNLAAGLVLKPGFKIRSLHFGTKLSGYNILKGQGYGWDGRDYIRAKKIKAGVWKMAVPVRGNDPRGKARRFVRGNCYIRTVHNEIYYFDLRKWKVDPLKAFVSDGHGGGILDIDLAAIPEKN